jgi:hypothetical protein
MLKTRLLHPESLAPLGAPCQGAGVLIADGDLHGIGVRLPHLGGHPTGGPPARRPVTGGEP